MAGVTMSTLYLYDHKGLLKKPFPLQELTAAPVRTSNR